MDQLLKVVRPMQCILILVKHMYQRALETSQHTLQLKRFHATQTQQLQASFSDYRCAKKSTSSSSSIAWQF